MNCGKCQICGNIDNLTKHHTKPSINGKKRKPHEYLMLCFDCHNALHRLLPNKKLNEMTKNQQKKFIWANKEPAAKAARSEKGGKT